MIYAAQQACLEAEIPPPDIITESGRAMVAHHSMLIFDVIGVNRDPSPAKLDPCDRSHCAIIAERLSLSLDAVAGALHMPADKLGELVQSRTAKGAGGLSIPLKRTISHFAGRKLNKHQEEVNSRSSGMQQSFYANQLIDLIESKLLDTSDEKLLDRLRKLNELLDDVLAVK